MLVSMLMPLPPLLLRHQDAVCWGCDISTKCEAFSTEVCDLDTHNESEPSGMWSWQLLYQEQDGYVPLFPLQCFMIRFYPHLCHQTVRSAAAGVRTPTPAVFFQHFGPDLPPMQPLTSVFLPPLSVIIAPRFIQRSHDRRIAQGHRPLLCCGNGLMHQVSELLERCVCARMWQNTVEQSSVQCWPEAPEGDWISTVIGWHD